MSTCTLGTHRQQSHKMHLHMHKKHLEHFYFCPWNSVCENIALKKSGVLSNLHSVNAYLVCQSLTETIKSVIQQPSKKKGKSQPFQESRLGGYCTCSIENQGLKSDLSFRRICGFHSSFNAKVMVRLTVQITIQYEKFSFIRNFSQEFQKMCVHSNVCGILVSVSL